jgi:predicted amidohydrolase
MENARRSIAVAQTCPIRGDVDANLEEHLRLAGCAAAEGAELVLFPELSLTGYEIGLADQLAFSEDDSRIGPIVDLAASRGIIVVAGAPVRIDARFHIGAFIVSPDRTVRLYTKQRMGAFSEAARCDGVVPPAEATVFEPGDRNPLIRFAGGTAAVAICADVGRPIHPRLAAERGADTYLASMFVIPSDFEGDSAKLSRYAAEHSMVVALANFGSATGGLASAGRSSIWSAKGELLIQLGDTGAGTAVAIERAGGWQTKAILPDRSHSREAAWR